MVKLPKFVDKIFDKKEPEKEWAEDILKRAIQWVSDEEIRDEMLFIERKKERACMVEVFKKELEKRKAQTGAANFQV